MTGAARRVCVVGSGLSGLAAIRGLERAGHEVTCFEAGSDLGGMWRYGNDNGRSGAFASLSANVSWRRMQYPSFPLAGVMGEFPHHSELLAYLERYADVTGARARIAFQAAVERARPSDAGWAVTVADSEAQEFDALVVATGHYWDPDVPELPGAFAGTILHSHHYRVPERFAGHRVVVVGAGQSALDIAAEISGHAARTVLACRQRHHLIPRSAFGLPFDAFDSPLGQFVPLPAFRASSRALLRLARATPDPGELPPARHRFMEERWPVVVSAATQRALTTRAFACRPAISRLDGASVQFADGQSEPIDAIIFATGYRVSFPFLPDPLGQGDGWQFPLYRRVLSPDAEGLAFVGILEPGPGLFGVVERQAEWLGEVLSGRLPVPDRAAMWSAIDAGGEPRSRRQFASTGAHSLLCNRHAYLRTLGRDLRRARVRPPSSGS